ncbi:DUF3499 family protein [Desertimonas flava]|uniref:DUF3499 family protein n=1 Tax=Desertimonas flava TaxID=2064846 RepID=UPI0013C49513|nr:DUF3499 family protein [Desertimonas flava]
MSQSFGAPRVHRQCSRPTCSAAAVVTLTYEYRASQVWLDELTAERDPHDYDLCRRHAEQLKVPLGWHLLDRRLSAAAVSRDLLAG